MNDSSSLGPRWLPLIWLQPDVRRSHVMSLFFGAFTTIGLLTFVALATPYVLTVSLHVPQSQQGTMIGDLQFWQEIATLLCFGPVGIMADRIGRRQVFAAGLLLMGAGYALYGFATSMSELLACRIIYAAGVAASTAMLATVMADYPLNRSRGITVAITGVLNAIGIILVAVIFGKVPEIFVARGADAVEAGQSTNFIVAGICLLTAIVLAVGLKPGLPVHHFERPRFGQLVSRAFAEARNPRIALSYVSGFIMRAQLVVLGSFTVAWGMKAAVEQGVEPSAALSTGRWVFAIPSTAGLVWQLLVMTWFLDRVNRVTAVVVCTALGVAGYVGTLFIDNPLGPDARPLLILLGIGQISTFAGVTTLISQEAPPQARGSVMGMFNICGSLGIIISMILGGRLFDAYGPASPFVFTGALTAIVLVLAIICRIKAPGEGIGRKPASATAAVPAVD